MPQLRQTMAPPGATWWSGPAQGPAQPPPAPDKPQMGQGTGAISLGLGLVLVLVGSPEHLGFLVFIGLIAAAWGLWRLVTLSGKNRGQP
jgi:hypothetical protein